MLKTGDKAPDFMLQDQNFEPHCLSDYLGDWLLIYFYPKDFTSGCTTEACSIRDNFDRLKQKVKIVGISSDGVESHKKFSEKYFLPFTLLADPQRTAIGDYGANGIIFARRVSFLIDPKGLIEKIYNKVDPKKHVSQILQDIYEPKYA